MTYRRLRSLLLVVLVALLAGCGGGGNGGGGGKGDLGDSLGYLPKTAPLVGTFDTDVEGAQYKNLDKLLRRFPFGGQLKNQIKQAINRQGADYEKDVKPLLGGELVVGATDAKALTDDSVPDQFVFVYTADGGNLKDAVGKDSSYKEAGSLEGGTLYQNASDHSVVVVKGDTMVGAQDRAAVQAAFDRHGGGDKLTEADFNGAFQDLPADPILRVYGDAQALLESDPRTATARTVKWVGGLRKFAVTVNVEGDGLAIDARVSTEGVSPQELPVAGGDQSPGLARFGDYSVAQRDLSQSIKFIQSVAAVTDPSGFGNYESKKKAAGKKLGIDVDRDLIDQFTGDTTVAGTLDGSWSLRSHVRDPAAMQKTLDTVVKKGGTGDVKVSRAGDLAVADDGSDKVYFGMVDDVFVAGKTADGAKQIASVEPRAVAGAKGAMVFVANGEAIAKAALARSGQGGGAAGLFTGPIGDLTGYVTAGPDGMRAHAKLKVE